MNFWMPRYKDEFVKWLRERYPDRNWNKLNIKQLRGAYIGIRVKLGR